MSQVRNPNQTTSTPTIPTTKEPPSDPQNTIPQLVRMTDICRMLALQKSKIYELVATGKFARPLKLGTSRRAAARWLLSDVTQYVKTLTDSRPPSAPSTSDSLTMGQTASKTWAIANGQQTPTRALTKTPLTKGHSQDRPSGLTTPAATSPHFSIPQSFEKLHFSYASLRGF
jgi:predicted DNA-binding transcriptional regulator AlpA